MTVAKDSKDEDILVTFYKRLEENEEYRKKILEVLYKDYVHRDELTLVLEELKKQREDFNKRFEESNKRFEAVDKRFEQLIVEMNKRFEESNKRYEELREDMNKRFEAVDKRFEQLIAEMHRGFDEVYDALGEFSAKFGKRAEAGARRIAREILKAEGIDQSAIQHIILEDDEGEVFYPGFTTDIDLYYHDSESWLLEYKMSCDIQDVYHFDRVCQLAAIEGIEATRRIILATKIKEGVFQIAAKLGIEIWHATTENATKIERKKKTENN